MKYRPVKPQLKPGNKSSGKQPQPSPPCPHQWESHEDIARLENSLREAGGRRSVSRVTSRPRSSPQPQLPVRCQSTPPVRVVETPRNSAKIAASTCNATTTTTSSYTHTHTEKKEFISVKRRARLLEDIMTTPQPPFSSAEEAAAAVGLRPTDDLSHRETPPSTERSTPIKPEDIPGAVRVFPVPIAASSTPTASGNLHCNRSASVDMNGFVGSLGSTSQSPMTLPRATKHFRSQSCHLASEATMASASLEPLLRPKMRSGSCCQHPRRPRKSFKELHISIAQLLKRASAQKKSSRRRRRRH